MQTKQSQHVGGTLSAGAKSEHGGCKGAERRMSMQSHVPRPSVASHRPHTAHHATRAACSLASSVGDRGPSGAAAPAHGSQLGVGYTVEC